MSYTTKFVPKNKHKYLGSKLIICRSLWERSFAKYCDDSKRILKWAVEPFSIVYYDEGKKKNREYFPDFYIELEDGRKMVIEIKPLKETLPPTSKRGKTRKYLKEESTFITNQCKWKTANEFCERNGWKFVVFTEKTLSNMGIKIIQANSLLRRKRVGVEKKSVKYTNKQLKGK